MKPAAPTQAVALSYHASLFAPKLVAKGHGVIAEDIIRRAREAGVYVHQNPDLVRLLMRVDLDEHIPPALYLAIAQVLAWINHLDAPAPNTKSKT